MRTPLPRIVCVLAAVSLIAGCGDSDDSTTASSPTSASSTSSTAATGANDTTTASLDPKRLVPTGKDSSGFGEFKDSKGDLDELVDAFADPDTTEETAASSCTVAWPSIGVSAELVLFGSEGGDPCTNGRFVEARLTDPIWYTDTGVKPGSPAEVAERASLQKCKANGVCGVDGYALELHPSDCAGTDVPGVIAEVSGENVEALVVRWRGCE